MGNYGGFGVNIGHFQAFNRQPLAGIYAAKGNCMEFVCRHCDEIAIGKKYRVFSEEDGVTLLDMIVCRSCYDQARQLGLDGEEVNLDERSREQLPVVFSSGAAA